MVELTELQKQLDETKYFQSQTAKQDLGGRMEYCENCYFQKFDSNKGHLICNLDESSKVSNYVCAKNYLRRKDNGKTKQNTRTTNNGKS